MCTIYICSLHMKSQQESIWRFSWKRRLQVPWWTLHTTGNMHMKGMRYDATRKRLGMVGNDLSTPDKECRCLVARDHTEPTLPWTPMYIFASDNTWTTPPLNSWTLTSDKEACQAGCKAKVSPSIRSRPKKNIHPSLGQHWALLCHSKCYSFFPRS